MNAKAVKQSGGGKMRVVYFDVLRAVAPIFVVMIHALVTFGGHTTRIHCFQELGRWAVPVFFMISGALLLNPKKKIDTKIFLKKNLVRFLIILAAWSVIYGVLFLIFQPWGKGAFEVGKRLTGEGSYHLWFLYTLIACYLLIPALRWICTNRRLLYYLIFVMIAVGFVMPFIKIIIGLIADLTQNGLIIGVGLPFSEIAEEISVYNLLFFFILGYFLSTEKFDRKMRLMIYGLGIASLIVDIIWIYVAEKRLGIMETASYKTLPVLCTSAAIFVFIRYLFEKKKVAPRVINFMAKHSLGVYLVHLAVLIFILDKIEFFHGDILVMGVATIVAYMMSLGLSWLLSKIPLVRRIV